MPGPAVAAIDLALDPARWAALGFAADADGVSRVGATAIVLTGAGHDGPVLPAWTLRGDGGPDEVDGIPTRWSAEPPAAADRHPNTALTLDHVVVQTPDSDRTFAALQSAGMTLRRERTAGTGSRALRQGFFRHGEAIVEVVGPLQAAADAATARAGLWGLTFTVADLDAAAALLGDGAGTVRPAVQPGRRILTVRAEAAAGLPLALMD